MNTESNIIKRNKVLEIRYFGFLGFTIFPIAEYMQVIYINNKTSDYLILLLTLMSFALFILTYCKDVFDKMWFMALCIITLISFLFFGIVLNILNHFDQKSVFTLIITIAVSMYTVVISNTKKLIAYGILSILVTLYASYIANIDYSVFVFVNFSVLITNLTMGYISYSRLKMQSQLRDAAKMKDMMMRESNHRIKNNLQMISSMLTLQEYSFRNRELSEQFKEAKDRIYAISLLHEQLYKQEDVDSIDIEPFLKSLVSYLAAISIDKEIDYAVNCEQFKIETQKAMIIGVVVNELITNILKHAFEDISEKKVNVLFEKKDKFYLKISDTGKGISVLNLDEKTSSFGLKLIEILSRQLNGSFDYRNTHKGSEWILVFS